MTLRRAGIALAALAGLMLLGVLAGYSAFQRWLDAPLGVGETPLEIAVGAILTQNTAWTTAEKAIAVLKSHRLLSLKRLARLSPAALSDRGASQLAPLIHSAASIGARKTLTAGARKVMRRLALTTA